MKQLLKEKKTIEAYNLLSSRDQISLIYNLKRKLTLQGFSSQKNHISSFIFGNQVSRVEHVARELLLRRLDGLDFNEKLLHAFAYNDEVKEEALAKEWRNVLAQDNIRTNNLFSSIRFAWHLWKRYFFNIIKSISMLISILIKKRKTGKQERYIQFIDIDRLSLPVPGKDKQYTVMDWYMQWQGNVGTFKEIHHNLFGESAYDYKTIRIMPARPFHAYLNGFKKEIHVLIWFAISVIISGVTLLAGKWINGVLLYEALLARMVQMTEPEYIANEYLFSVSVFSFRPLWTYVAEEKGALITNYSYSSSFNGFKKCNQYLDVEFFYDTTRWSRLLFWTDDYVNYIRKRVADTVQVVHTGSPVYLADYPYEFPSFTTKTVAVFDVTPVNLYTMAKLLPDPKYRTFENGKLFLRDIYEVFSEKGITILWKRKRSFSSMHSAEYMAFCNEFEKLPGVIAVHPDVAASRVIDKSDFVITMPFTSTAFIGSYSGKVSVFYDATGTLYKDDRGAQGLPVVSGRKELFDWADTLTTKQV